MVKTIPADKIYSILGNIWNPALFICVSSYSTVQTLQTQMDLHIILPRRKPKFCLLRHNNTNVVGIQFPVQSSSGNKAVLSLIISQLLFLASSPLAH